MALGSLCALARIAKGDDTTGDAPPTTEATSLSLTPDMSWNDTATTPSICPNICLNAQTQYMSAKFVAHVQPSGVNAIVSVTSGPVDVSPAVVSDGTEVTVSANGSGSTGNYMLGISAGGSVQNSAGGVVFSLATEDVSIVPGPLTPRGRGKTFQFTNDVVTPPRTFNATISMVLHIFNGPASFAPFTQTTDWQYKLDTVPGGVYTGKASSATTITATTTRGFVTAGGFIATSGVAASTGQADFNDVIAVSGLAGGNGSSPLRAYTASAPTLVLVPIDLQKCNGATTWTNPGAVYTVGGNVDAVDTMQMDGSRGGAFPVAAASAAGIAQDTGFTLTQGAFALTK
jgi:hypothetical protein